MDSYYARDFDKKDHSQAINFVFVVVLVAARRHYHIL